VTVDEFLARLTEVEVEATNQWRACCPGPRHYKSGRDTSPSLAMSLGDDDRILLYCRTAGCKPEEIVTALGLSLADLFVRRNGHHGNGQAERDPRMPLTLTVKELAAYKHLPEAFLRGLGLEDVDFWVGIPYYTLDGKLIARKFRKALTSPDHSHWHWPKGQKLSAYGQWLLPGWRGRDDGLLLVEGESDCWASWFHGVPCLGLPGAQAIKTLEAAHLTDMPRLWLHQEPGDAGASFIIKLLDRLRALEFTGEVRHLRMPEAIKDLADLHAADPDQFTTRLTGQMEMAPVLDLTAPITVEQSLSSAVRDIMNSKMPRFDKPRAVTDLIFAHFSAQGRWVKQEGDERLLYFSTPDRRLYDLDSRAFEYLIAHTTKLSPAETLFNHAVRRIVADVARTTVPTPVRALSHYDAASGLLAVSDGGPGVWVHAEPGALWEHVDNGTDGLLFTLDEATDPWTPEWGADDEQVLQTYYEGFRFGAGEAGLTRADQQVLLRVWMLNMFFPPLRYTKPIPAFLGGQGSGKTSAVRRVGQVLLGPRFDVIKADKEKEDGCRAAITSTTLVGLDNADKEFPWLENFLATYATGTRYDLRQLYTTNDRVSYAARALLVLNSRDPRFNRPDVAERLLPLWCDVPDPAHRAFKTEHALRDALAAHRPRWWGAWLGVLGRLADGLATVPGPETVAFRMADYASFGWRWAAICGFEVRAWTALVVKLEQAQIRFAAEGDGLIAVLRDLLTAQPNGVLGPIDTGALFQTVRREAELHGYLVPKTAKGFGQALTAKRRLIEVELGVTWTERKYHAGAREIELKRRIPRTPVRDPEDELA
jgi:hypothetical protein